MTDVFLSYAQEDRERARQLAAALQAAGWSVWWDREIKVGQAFDEVIERALDGAKSVVVLWSAASIGSEWVKNEAASAAERGVLVPVSIDDVKPPLEFRRRQTANLIGWDGGPSAAGFQALCDGIAALAGAATVMHPEQPAVGRRADTRWIFAGGAVVAVLLAGGAYFAGRGFRPEAPPSAQEPAAGAGVFAFTWPGSDCWEIDRGDTKVGGTCGSGEVALQAGTYSVKPIGRVAFVPFQVVVKADGISRETAGGGTLDFRWPGNDCWEVLRGTVSAARSCGGGKQALQAGTYTLKPASSSVFQPISINVIANKVISEDAKAGILDFKWPNSDCWEVYRGDAKAVGSCGSGKQALQAGDYVLKPTSQATFKPISLHIKAGATLRVP